MLGFGFCFSQSFFEQSLPSVAKLHIHDLNHATCSCHTFEFLLVFFVALAGISLLSEVNRVVTRLINRGVVVLRLLDSGLRI